MFLTLEVPAEVAEKLERDAASLGLSVSDYALRRLGVLPPQEPWDGAKFVEGLIRDGLIGPDTYADKEDTSADELLLGQIFGRVPDSGGGVEDSSVLARRLREQSQNRDRSS
jgi:hypothetical protein